MIKYTLPKHLLYILTAYFVVICFFFLFRLVILPLNTEVFSALLDEEAQGFWLIIRAFIMGFRFDTVIACYVLAPVSLSLIIAYFLNIKSLLYYKIIHYFTLIVFSVCFIISLIDIPYFDFFFNRFTIQGLAWMDSPDFVFKMIVQDFTYLLSLVGLLLIIGIYVFIMQKFFRHYLASQAEAETLVQPTLKTRYITAFVSIFLLLFLFLGIRGRLEQKSPIRVGTAYFSNNPLINQMGLNPVFTFIKSLEEKAKLAKTELNLMDKTEAQAFVKAEFERTRSIKIGERDFMFDENTNVVLVMMESFGTCFIGDFGAEKLTPYFDQLIHESVSYDNVYAAGIHTYNGVYSSLFGQPALMDKHTMHYTVIPEVKGGLHAVLKEKGYNTYYFTTHDDQFDNIGGFLSANGAEKIISVHDYDSAEVKSTMGVPDHVMFDKIIEQLNTRKSTKPFFVSVLTGSFHTPFVLPEDIPLQTKSENLKDKMIEYSDWAIGKFIQDAKKSDWFDNTLFVFVADHGAYKGVSPYEIAMSYHHTPYLFYAPGKLTPKRVENIGLQIDTPAMIYSYLGIDNQQTLGIDFDIHPRKYAYFSANDKLGVLDEEYFYIWNRNGQEYLYKYKTKDRTNYIKAMPERANEMKQYAFAMLMN